MKNETSIFVKIAVAIAFAAIIITVFTLVIKYNSLVVKRDELKAQVEKEKLQLEKLMEEADRDYDEEYIKKIAREELGYRMPDEIIYYNDLLK